MPPLKKAPTEDIIAKIQDCMDRAAAGLPVPELEGKPITTYTAIVCHICGKLKGQPPSGCSGHYAPLPMPVAESGELYRFTSIGCLYRLRKLPSQPMLPERIILERRVSHLHEKEEWDIEWRQQ